jgi:carbon monoxide dehydrogenase subunit G
MAFRIEERFPVKASPDAVFGFLVDARRVVTCLPGAELTEAVDARTFRGTMKVKVGPVTVAYQGRVLLTDVDAAAHRVRLTGEAREGSGAGSAKMTLESVTRPLAGGGAEVAVQADVDVAGRAVQLGRGMMEQVSRQVFREFAARLCAAVEAAAPAAAGAAPAAAEAAPHAEPLRALPLLLRAAWAAFVAFLRRLLGRR